MPVQGDLRTMPVPEILMWMSQSQKTGTLAIHTNGIVHKLAFEGGALIFSSSSDRNNTLGKLLIAKGLVTEEMHKRARALRKEKSVAVAKALLDLNAMSEDQMLRFLRKKAEKELFQLFDCSDGEFVFDDQELPKLDLLPLRIDVAKLLLRITQQKDEKGEFDFDATGIRLEIPTDI